MVLLHLLLCLVLVSCSFCYGLLNRTAVNYKCNNQREERCYLTVRERILAIRLAERIGRQSDYAKSIGVAVELKENTRNFSSADRKED